MAGTLRVDHLEEDRWERSRRVGWLDMDAVRSARALVIGAGALGNEVVKNLALSGVGDITIVDMDQVARSNLNRCLFFREEDAASSRGKAEALAQRAKELDPQLLARALPVKVQELDGAEFERHDIAFGCLDNIAARLHLNSHAYYHGLPLIDGGTLGTTGKVQVVVPPSTPCLQCAMNRTHLKVLEKRFSCTGTDTSLYEPKLAAEITTTSIIAALQVREGLKLLSRQEDRCLRSLLYYNGLSNEVRELEVGLDPECPVHEGSNA
jgi:molybdopterin/thiamine biosynthesis adenylyltransferase